MFFGYNIYDKGFHYLNSVKLNYFMDDKINKCIFRDSSFELLRIVCMLFVIGGHLVGKGMQITYDNTLLGGGRRLHPFKTSLLLLYSCRKHFYTNFGLF